MKFQLLIGRVASVAQLAGKVSRLNSTRLAPRILVQLVYQLFLLCRRRVDRVSVFAQNAGAVERAPTNIAHERAQILTSLDVLGEVVIFSGRSF